MVRSAGSLEKTQGNNFPPIHLGFSLLGFLEGLGLPRVGVKRVSGNWAVGMNRERQCLVCFAVRFWLNKEFCNQEQIWPLLVWSHFRDTKMKV